MVACVFHLTQKLNRVGVGGFQVEGGKTTPNTAPLDSWSEMVKMGYFPCLQVCEMAADISESGGHDCKGDPRSNTKLDADYPLRVLYCGGKCWKAENGFLLNVFLYILIIVPHLVLEIPFSSVFVIW